MDGAANCSIVGPLCASQQTGKRGEASDPSARGSKMERIAGDLHGADHTLTRAAMAHEGQGTDKTSRQRDGNRPRPDSSRNDDHHLHVKLGDRRRVKTRPGERSARCSSRRSIIGEVGRGRVSVDSASERLARCRARTG